MTKQKTAAIYARFSSDLQKDRSIEDQNVVCENYAKREGFEVISKFDDRAKSGASLFGRKGIEALITAARAREFDAVIVEGFERLSRDQEDIQYLFKRLNHAEVELHSVSDGRADPMKVTMRGMIGSEYLKTLAAQIKRGHNGRVRAGKFPGSVTYGYDRVPGQPGERVINKEQAKIVRRIFSEYGAGISPREIAMSLTADSIPTPTGGSHWNHQCIVGGGEKNGLISNKLYIGEIVWNKNHTVRNPDTGAKSIRRTAMAERIVTPVPHLRIINQPTWDAAQKVRQGRSRWSANGGKSYNVVTRHQHLLMGLLRCGVCSSHMVITSASRGTHFVTCAAAHSKSACSHRKGYDLAKLTRLVVDNFRNNLLDPRRHAAAAEAAHEAYAAEAKKNNMEKTTAERQLARLNLQIGRLVDAIENSDRPIKELTASLETKEQERVGLVERVRLLGASHTVTLHPQMMDTYRQNIDRLHEELSRDTTEPEVIAAFGNLMHSIVVQPTGYRQPYVVDAFGRLSAIMGFQSFPTMRSITEGVTRSVIGNPAFPRLPVSQQENSVVSLGRWCAA